ncbi:MAG TPA: class I SAM-dependent methyltransferase [Candidatus Marinimicrobia bacterium]|nr:class I SAM-dependent methyltransferase [Candidatus Neomarinimicrobiota bacterium]
MSLFAKLSYISRKRKLEMFDKLMKPTSQTKVLDIGAEINPDGDRGLQLIDSYTWKKKLSAINVSPKNISQIRRYYPEIEAVVGDACRLPWPDKHFDIVYSNAVIEHVGDFEKQKKMAAEVMRVGKRWFVTTPNRWYPFEFHMRLPFITWLPCHSYLWVGRFVSYNHVQRKYVFGAKHSGPILMTAKELERCFPCSKIIKQRVTFMAETLIAVGRDI